VPIPKNRKACYGGHFSKINEKEAKTGLRKHKAKREGTELNKGQRSKTEDLARFYTCRDYE